VISERRRQAGGRPRWSASLGIVAACAAGCGGGHRPADPGRPVADRSCATSLRPVAARTLERGISGWYFGRAPLYISFLQHPAFLGRAHGRGSTLVIRRDDRTATGYGVKLASRFDRRVPGRFTETVRSITAGGSAGFGQFGSTRDELESSRSFRYPGAEAAVPGLVYFSGPGCYALDVNGPGVSYSLKIPVTFGMPD
jgi:hypothetical protein